VSFTHRSTGDPGIVMQSKKGVFVAYDAVCPHAGCTVGYSASQKQFACPCHGSTFALATGVRTGGPTPTGLKKLLVTVSKGHLFVH
jgi:thiosulfate dehydrogenase [quinone] large subunit